MSENNFTDSITVKALHPQGFDVLLTLRGPSAELLPRFERAIDWLVEKGYTPNVSSESAAPTNGSEPICPTHNKPMKPSKHGGFFCPVKIADNDGTGRAVYCKQKVK